MIELHFIDKRLLNGNKFALHLTSSNQSRKGFRWTIFTSSRATNLAKKNAAAFLQTSETIKYVFPTFNNLEKPYIHERFFNGGSILTHCINNKTQELKNYYDQFSQPVKISWNYTTE